MSTELAKRLQKAMGDRSLRALARDLDVAVGTVEGWLKGWRSPDIRHISRLASYLEVAPSDILAWEMEAVTLDRVNPRYVNRPVGLLAHPIPELAA